jgi:UDP-3-O-[3-hydroxymyristoyl] N-acetylglucosamine deacetylase
MKKQSLLIVDDEASICKTLAAVFTDEGFDIFSANSGEDALLSLEKKIPTAVILDIWMPGLDGIETLKRIKLKHPELPVVMMSGHASIATAVEATRIGASDFVEKPLDLEDTVRAVKRVISGMYAEESSALEEGAGASQADVKQESLKITPVSFFHEKLRGDRLPQKTIASSALLYGQGLHSGKKSGLQLEPLPPNSGIHFVGMSGGETVPAHLDFVQSTGYATTVKLGSTQVGTIEHLMSALSAFGITNLLIKCNGEVPVMDGSALEFCSLLKEIGVKEQAGEWYELKIPELIEVRNGEEWIRAEPGEGLTINYTLSYPEPVGMQEFSFTCNSPEDYEKLIAPARTFGFVRDIGALHKQGLALGGRFDNFVLIGGEGPINTALRFPDEFVRHKILDAIGDLSLLGRRLAGKITARMTGHSDNIALLMKIVERMR